MIIIETKAGVPIMQGETVLHENETFCHTGNIGLDVCCKNCGYPFADSLQKVGRIFDTVICFQCEKEIAAIIQEGESETAN